MSFDVSMDELECPTCHRFGDQVMSENITHNVNEIAERCLVAGGAGVAKTGTSYYRARSWGRLEGWTGAEVLSIAERALAELLKPERQDEWAKLEPDNGWGSRRCVERVLRALITASKAHPNAVVHTNG